MKKTIGWIILICIIGLIIFRVVQTVNRKRQMIDESISSKEEVFAVEVIKPIRGNIMNTKYFPGVIKGENQVQVFPDVPGRLLEYTVREGQNVRKDDIIALIDRTVPGMKYEPAKVRTPVSGIMARQLLDIGQAVAPQVPVAIVADMSKIKVVISVGEKLLPSINIGMYAEIRLNDMGNTEFRGKLDRLSSFIDPTSRSAYAEVLLLDSNKDIIPGSFAGVEIILEEKKDVILLPRKAVIEDLETRKYYIFLIKEDIAKKLEIKPGIITQENIEILSGVDVNDIIITKGKDFLKGGERVKIVD
ncbi:efflux RND transporter periplasmic adaptor subunit [candidate division WOR-3 bacterium]|nr:efflux RND transporter periplasmic adaptor subunit [candidate division WOR-3 bacterium]